LRASNLTDEDVR